MSGVVVWRQKNGYLTTKIYILVLIAFSDLVTIAGAYKTSLLAGGMAKKLLKPFVHPKEILRKIERFKARDIEI
ncbi:MAG: hypothetical protein N2654_01140 [Deltaproteobacteria bacterium]|nr:hypothetical protein [Deltaproteobacteria bacterium]